MAPPPGISPLALGLGPEPLSVPIAQAFRAAASQGTSPSLCSPWTVGTLRTVFPDFFGGSSTGWALGGCFRFIEYRCVVWGRVSEMDPEPHKGENPGSERGRALPEVPQQVRGGRASLNPGPLGWGVGATL